METPWVADVRTWGLEIPELSRIVTGAREDELLEILSQTKDSVTDTYEHLSAMNN